MSYPNIRSRRENFFNRWTSPTQNRRNFLHKNPLDSSWPLKQVPVNVKKESELYQLKVAMPGFKKSEISVTLNGGFLTVREERSKLEMPVDKYIRQEFDYDIVERKFKLSEEINHEKIEAQYENGILNLTFLDVPPHEESYVKKIVIQ